MGLLKNLRSIHRGKMTHKAREFIFHILLAFAALACGCWWLMGYPEIWQASAWEILLAQLVVSTLLFFLIGGPVAAVSGLVCIFRESA